MVKIVIDEETGSTDDMADLLEQIATSLREGNTSGFYPHWHIVGEEKQAQT